MACFCGCSAMSVCICARPWIKVQLAASLIEFAPYSCAADKALILGKHWQS